MIYFTCRDNDLSDDSDDEMEVEGAVPPTTPTTPRPLAKPPKHDLMMTEEVMDGWINRCMNWIDTPMDACK